MRVDGFVKVDTDRDHGVEGIKHAERRFGFGDKHDDPWKYGLEPATGVERPLRRDRVQVVVQVSKVGFENDEIPIGIVSRVSFPQVKRAYFVHRHPWGTRPLS